MSFKSKNLEYDDRQPAFLRRLRGEISGSTDDPDRQVNPVARPKGASRLKKDEDDGPTYVMEDTQESLSKAEYEALLIGRKEPKVTDRVESNEDGGEGLAEDESTQPKQKVAAVGGLGKKRKAAKIVGDETEEGLEKAQFDNAKPAEPDKKRLPKKKKTKAVKLSFGDDENE
ncbi:hypothetical protein EJ08DRAFT_53628 [Tothia fuscella]|uniref:DUF4604 domain-containing protein n=1 Tax=Tothia fuscella TaxID=1048955 RepID=A0A9P4NFD6_9PEZI|nr:hypothetical protein EJ08DRAFT_53628 [Tothia fuscella]